jgi:hypothetical protein
MIIISLVFREKRASNDNRFSRKNYVIIGIIIILQKTLNLSDNGDNCEMILYK